MSTNLGWKAERFPLVECIVCTSAEGGSFSLSSLRVSADAGIPLYHLYTCMKENTLYRSCNISLQLDCSSDAFQ